jgi:hypothetical protein
MKKKNTKLTLNKETLRGLGVRAGRGFQDVQFDSCVDSCYIQSCGGGCTISTEIKTAVETQ